MSTKVKKRIGIILILLLLILGGASAFGIHYLYDFAIARSEKSFMNSGEASGTDEKEQPIENWDFLKEKPKTWTLVSKDHLKLKGTLIENPVQKHQKTKKIMVLVHGYTSNSRLLKSYAEMFYKMGYTLFLPDARGHGKSQGDYIGFGWPDRLDLKAWIEKLCRYAPNSNIGLWGVSMGGAEVMMVSGEKLPKQVKVIIEDSGYDSTLHELEYQLNEMFHLPSFPIIPLASKYTEYKAGYNFYESDAVKQLHKNKLPTLFIHGDSDTFVPVKMVNVVYEATRGPKEKVIFKGASHARNYEINPKKYKQICQKFLNRYMPAR